MVYSNRFVFKYWYKLTDDQETFTSNVQLTSDSDDPKTHPN